MKRNYFYYPYKRTPCILYSYEEIRHTLLFRVLLNKMFGDTYKRKVRETYIINAFFKIMSNVSLEVPHPGVEIIYQGFERKVYFVLNACGQVDHIFVLEKEKKNPEQRPFMGYPIFWNKCDKTIVNSDILKKFLMNHWQSLNSGQAVIHGDLTPYNILVNEKGVVTTIDPLNIPIDSLLYDHFYFYSYFLQMIDYRIFGYPKNYYSLKMELQKIFLEIFADENKSVLMKEIEHISIEPDSRLDDITSCKKRFKSLFHQI